MKAKKTEAREMLQFITDNEYHNLITLCFFFFLFWFLIFLVARSLYVALGGLELTMYVDQAVLELKRSEVFFNLK